MRSSGGARPRAVENFPVSSQPIPAPVIHWLGRIKAAAARVNAELGGLDADLADRIAAAGDAVGAGDRGDQFPVDVFQTQVRDLVEHERQRGDRQPGRGWSPRQRPRQHGPVVKRRLPSAKVHLAALGEVSAGPVARPRRARRVAARKADEFAGHVKAGRTHLMDAVPVTLGQEFGGYATQIRLGADRIRDTLGQVGQIRSAAPPPA